MMKQEAKGHGDHAAERENVWLSSCVTEVLILYLIMHTDIVFITFIYSVTFFLK